MSAPQIARNRENGSSGVFVPTLITLALLLGALVVFAGFWTDIQWYSQLKAARVFWTQWGWAIALGVIGFIVVGGIVAANIAVVRGGTARTSGKPRVKGKLKSLAEMLVKRGKESAPADPGEVFGAAAEAATEGLADYRTTLDRHPWIARLGIPALLGLVFGAPLATEWRTYVLWLNRTPFGTQDAQFGKDVSFYVFTMPVIQSVLALLVTALAVSGVVALIGHFIYGGVSSTEGKLSLTHKARIHFGILGAAAMLLLAAYLWMGRYDMLLENNGKFSGASFTAINANLPGRTIMAIVALLVAGLFVVAAVKGVWRLAGIGIVTAIVAGLVVGSAYPYLVQRFQVVPNAVEKESPYIQRNIDATLKAYGIDNIDVSEYSAKTEAEAGQLRSDAEATAQLRVLDPNEVSGTFNQLQRNRQYYTFDKQLSVDRYTINGQARDTVIAVRELDLSGLEESQRTWVNEHTVYTHGYGVAAAYGNTTTADGEPSFFQQGIPSSGELGEYEPRVYFGTTLPTYSVVGAPEGSGNWELDYPMSGAENGQKSTTYTGDGGPSVGSMFSKLMFAVKFRDTDLFFSSRVTPQSQILYDRDPRERVSKVAPYLTLDSRMYPAVVDTDGDPATPKRLVWIIDGYTTTNQYPYSARQSLAEADATTTYGTEPEQVNYIRNSVKAVVDAYDGSVNLYQWDKKDPIVNAWGKVFPGTLKPVSEISGDLMSHMRYPEDLFKVQRTLLSRYHVTEASAFYSGGDFWDIPQEPTAAAGTNTLQPPYYLTLQMPGQKSAEFSLSTSFILGGTSKQNVMTGFLAVDSEAGNEKGKVREGYGKLRLLELPKDVTVPGPGQAENNFVTDSNVSTTLNLLKQGGTQVIMGNLLTLPVGGGLLYVQPVYVQAAANSGSTSYPISQYVLTTFGKGSKIGFAPTLQESLNQAFGGNSGANAGDADVSGKKDTTAPAPAPKSDTPSTPSPSASASAPQSQSPSGSAKERLNSALGHAQQAINESNEALKKGDWAAYGESQKKLQKALEDAVAAQAETESK